MATRLGSDHANVRRVDASLTIYELLVDPSIAFDLVKAELHGEHPAVINRISDRAYYILDGHGIAQVGEETLEIASGDTIKIPKGRPHSISGALTYLIITSPPFSPTNEEMVVK